jgi:hypothetical protein
MIFRSLISRAHSRLEKRRRYLQLVGEIEGMSARDLADIRGDRVEMLHAARREVYG